MNGSIIEHRLEAEDYVIVINTHKDEIKRLKVMKTAVLYSSVLYLITKNYLPLIETTE